MSPAYDVTYVLALLERAIAERNDERGVGGAARVAAEMGTSDSIICQLRSGGYRSPMKWHRLIVEKFGNETIHCPVIGDSIPLDRCRREREHPYSTGNPTRRAFSQTCPECGGKP